MSFPIANPDAPVSYSPAGPTSRLTARAVAAASATPPLTSSRAVLTFVNFSSILQGGHNGGATSSSEASLPSSSSTSASVSESTTSNSNFSSTESKALPVGVIVGGSIGGLAVVLMAIILLVSARHQSRRMRGLGARGGMTRMANLKDRPPRITEVMPFTTSAPSNSLSSNTTQLQSSYSASSEQSTKPFQIINSSGFNHPSQQIQEIGRPSNTDATSGKRQIIVTDGESSVHLPPGLVGAQNRATEQSGDVVANPDFHHEATIHPPSFIEDDSPPAYRMTSGPT
ncbi:hypothetical protein CVT25_003652 [Psilocybe cyanescens]|uniref:Mid2 domain-containing protein n=1 Tax=Psilocybe cyanescens TaxID=93625 RepID=A0A409WPE5_PSICY|nr:hypothetical protein CVT25_003652 [Psilocybe cyanescens]